MKSGGTRAFKKIEGTCQDDRLTPNCFKRGVLLYAGERTAVVVG